MASSREITRLVDWARRRGRELEDLYPKHNDPDFRMDSASFLVKEIVRHLSDALDQTMVLFWERQVRTSEPAKRPAIYFPTETSDKATLEKLQRGGMGDLQTTHPNAFSYIMAHQPHNNPDYEFLPEFKQLTNIGHNRLHKLEKPESNGMSLLTVGPIFLSTEPLIPNHPSDGVVIHRDRIVNPDFFPMELSTRVVLKIEDLERDASSYLKEAYFKIGRIISEFILTTAINDPGHGPKDIPSDRAKTPLNSN